MQSIPLPYRILGVLALAVSVFLAGWRFGYRQEHESRVAEVATIQAGLSEANARAALDNRRKLETAQALGDVLFGRLASVEATLSKTSQELDREIRRRTTGRHCLNSDVVSLLNAAADSNAGNHLPEAPGSAPAEDGAFATDTDVALWAKLARTEYDICRARLGALIDFEDKRP